MSLGQANILRDAPRYRMAYGASDDVRLLIPGTEKALQWAAQQGAERVDSLAFHRLDPDGSPSSDRIGDFHCRVMSLAPHTPIPIHGIIDAIINVLILKMKVLAPIDLCVTYINKRGLEVIIPSQAFYAVEWPVSVRSYYTAVARGVRTALSNLTRKELHLSYDGTFGIPNRKLDNGEFAVQFRMSELAAMSEDDLSAKVRSPQPLPAPGYCAGISPDLHRELIQEARRSQKAPRPGPGWNAPEPFYLLSSRQSDPGMACAHQILSWVRERGIREFSRRNAIRRMDGKFTLHEGVDAALHLLQSNGYVKECPPLRCNYPGHPPGPWYLLHPDIPHRQKPT